MSHILDKPEHGNSGDIHDYIHGTEIMYIRSSEAILFFQKV